MLKPVHCVSFYAQFRDDSHDLLQQVGGSPQDIVQKKPEHS